MPLLQRIRSAASGTFPETAMYCGPNGTTWFAGANRRAPTIASMYCGEDAHITRRSRLRSARIVRAAREQASAGSLAIVSSAAMSEPACSAESITVPVVVHQYAELPGTIDALHAQVRTSTTREDLRRIRKAGFTYRVTTDRAEVETFYERFYLPLLNERYPDDAAISSPDDLLNWLEDGGELVCAEQDGEWVAGFFNVCHDDRYALNWMGVRDGDLAIRNSRVIAALYVRSMERGVELGRTRATFGRSLPFLGKGLVWFKAKWGGVIARDPHQRATMEMWLDLRHQRVRRFLADSPVIVCDGSGALAAVRWLDGGNESDVRTVCRDAGRFPGIARWYVLAAVETIVKYGEALAACEAIAARPVPAVSTLPCWAGGALHC